MPPWYQRNKEQRSRGRALRWLELNYLRGVNVFACLNFR